VFIFLMSCLYVCSICQVKFISLCGVPHIMYWYSLSRSLLCSVQSKAFYRSKITVIISLFRFSVTLFMILNSNCWDIVFVKKCHQVVWYDLFQYVKPSGYSSNWMVVIYVICWPLCGKWFCQLIRLHHWLKDLYLSTAVLSYVAESKRKKNNNLKISESKIWGFHGCEDSHQGFLGCETM
jgi:hypothetical protein